MTTIDDEVRIFEPAVHTDDRGSFYESYNESAFDDWVGREVRFVQDNHSTSARGVLRGLHYQLPPAAQAKLVRVTRGAVFDVVVDIRRSGPTFRQWRGFELSKSDGVQLWIPEGFAHGFLALTDGAEVQYKTTEPFVPDLDRAVRWNDEDLAIEWPVISVEFRLSAKDATAPTFRLAEVFH